MMKNKSNLEFYELRVTNDFDDLIWLELFSDKDTALSQADRLRFECQDMDYTYLYVTVNHYQNGGEFVENILAQQTNMAANHPEVELVDATLSSVDRENFKVQYRGEAQL